MGKLQDDRLTHKVGSLANCCEFSPTWPGRCKNPPVAVPLGSCLHLKEVDVLRYLPVPKNLSHYRYSLAEVGGTWPKQVPLINCETDE